MSYTILWAILLSICIIAIVVISVMMYNRNRKPKEDFSAVGGAINTDNITTIHSVMPVEQLSSKFVTPTLLTESLPDTIPVGLISMFSGSIIPNNWVLCDGNNGTPNLVGKFILAGDGKEDTKVGGSSEYFDKDAKYNNTEYNSAKFIIPINKDNLPKHDHPIYGFITQHKYNRNNKSARMIMRFTENPHRRTPHNRISGFEMAHRYKWGSPPGEPTEENETTETPLELPKIPYYTLAYIMYIGDGRQ